MAPPRLHLCPSMAANAHSRRCSTTAGVGDVEGTWRLFVSHPVAILYTFNSV